MHNQFMKEALIEAKKALLIDETPVGAVMVYQNEVIARAHNRRETDNSPFSHAEMLVIQEATQKLNTWKLNDCTLYVTLEPCVMCAGALIQARVGAVVFGAYDPKGGCFGSLINLNDISFNHKIQLIGGVLEEKSSELLMSYFQNKRKEAIKIKKIDNEDDFKAARELRYEVFVIEQNVDPALEYDEYDVLNDNLVIHFIAKQQDKTIGTLRLIKNTKDKILKVGRVAVKKDKRNLKVGSKLMMTAEVYASNNGFKTLILGSQLVATGFYESCGYQKYGEIFLDANIEHIMMKKELD